LLPPRAWATLNLSSIANPFGDKDFIAPAPGEFRLVDSVVLKPGEKHNQE